MSNPSQAPDAMSPDDALPPVEPPSAGFIVQLFVVPAVIVTIIVMVWMMFNWLAHMGDNPDDYVRALQRDNTARWQSAVNLANALRRPNNPLKHDAEFAQKLSGLLVTELESDSPRQGEEDIRLRVFLCRALGEIYVPESLPALLQAATLNRAGDELEVRRSAIQAIAVLADNLDPAELAQQQDLMPTLLELAGDRESEVRSAAAYTLGVIGGEAASEKLDILLSDAAPNVRYNAATGLARHGEASAVPVLVEMLDVDRVGGVDEGAEESEAEMREAAIVLAALSATSKLAAANPTADVGPLHDAVSGLTDVKMKRIRLAALQVQRELEQHGSLVGAP